MGGFSAAMRSRLEKRLGEYLTVGGFPEVQALSAELRRELLQSCVDTVLFRDVVERYDVAQVAALRWLTRKCLRNPAGSFSVHRLHLDLKAQGLGVAKDTLHAMVGYLQDAFLIRAVSLATDSERRRSSNPRKVYPVDLGLITGFDRSGRGDIGHALETVALHELDRRRAEVAYVRTRSGFEVDFRARLSDGREELIQVCADPSPTETWEREIRALVEAKVEYPRARCRMLVLTLGQALSVRAKSVDVQPAHEWLLMPP